MSKNSHWNDLAVTEKEIEFKKQFWFNVNMYL